MAIASVSTITSASLLPLLGVIVKVWFSPRSRRTGPAGVIFPGPVTFVVMTNLFAVLPTTTEPPRPVTDIPPLFTLTELIPTEVV